MQEILVAAAILIATVIFLVRIQRRDHIHLALPAFVLSDEQQKLVSKCIIPEKCYSQSTWGTKAKLIDTSKLSPLLVPVLVFVNPKSGGQKGDLLIFQLRAILPEFQVFQIGSGGCVPRTGLEFFKAVPNYRVLVCGGDGTVAWVLQSIDELDLIYKPPVAVLPLGTGNDLARVLGWGGGYSSLYGSSVLKLLHSVSMANASNLDRWFVETISKGKKKKTHVMNNYLGIGVDAQIAMNFHRRRERSPHLFCSRTFNKYFWYVLGGSKEILLGRFSNLTSYLQLECDGKILDLPDGIEGVIVLNIASYGGGVDLWGSESSMSDGMLDVVGVASSFQLGAAQVGLTRPMRLCQCKNVKITTKVSLPMQIDGEPKNLRPSVINISFQNQSVMLTPSTEFEMKIQQSSAMVEEVLLWAGQEDILNESQITKLRQKFNTSLSIRKRLSSIDSNFM